MHGGHLLSDWLGRASHVSRLVVLRDRRPGQLYAVHGRVVLRDHGACECFRTVYGRLLLHDRLECGQSKSVFEWLLLPVGVNVGHAIQVHEWDVLPGR